MTAEVKKLPVQHREAMTPSPEIIKEAEAILELAKEGKVQGFAWALVYHDGLTPAGETTNGFHAESGTRYAMSHAIAQLSWRWREHQEKP